MLRDHINGRTQFGRVGGVATGEHVLVGEVTPSGVGGTAIDGCDELLGVDHRQGIAVKLDVSAE